MVSYSDEPVVEITSEDVVGSEYEVEFDVKLTCGECEGELKSTSLTGTAEIDHECPAAADDYTFVSSEATGTQRSGQVRNKKGVLAPSRYQKTFYGGQIEATVECDHCHEQIIVTVEEDEQASGFDELV